MLVSRRRFLYGSTMAAAGLALAGCTRGGSGASDRLRILTWPEYIDVDDGADLGTVSRFRRSSGLRVDYVEEYNGNEEAFETLLEPTLGKGKRTGYDVIVPTYWAVARMLDEGWLEPVPLERVPNHVNVDPAFLGMPWDRGGRFHMPWQVGITGIAYNPRLTGREIRSVADLLDPRLRGRVGLVSEMRETVGLLMLTQGADPSRVTAAAAHGAVDRLEAIVASGQIARFTANEFVDALKADEFAACLAWSGDIVQLQAERPDIRFVIPDEGGIRWFDSMVIPKGAQNVAGAGDWMNFVYDPENAARITVGVQYISPVIGVREALDAMGNGALADNPILFPDDETRRRLYFWAGLDRAEEDEVQSRFSALVDGLA
ncbi:MAG TPA: spermidine/putrescine ABC transporter substrate-binding protein [Acidimicrobiales bacterium]|jgi:spermidine/putrescine transport system substrate-binding protein